MMSVNFEQSEPNIFFKNDRAQLTLLVAVSFALFVDTRVLHRVLSLIEFRIFLSGIFSNASYNLNTDFTS